MLITALVSGLSACGSTQNTDTQTTAHKTRHSSTVLLAKEKLNGHKVMPFGDKFWVANSENYGVMLLNSDGQIMAQHSGNYEGLDVRPLGKAQYLIASIEKEQGQVNLFRKSAKQAASEFELSASIKLEKASINNVCLYQSAKTQDIYAFILTAQNTVEQRMVYQANSEQVVNYLIRQFSAPPESSACAVDDQTAQLYIAEEMTGVWQYSVNPERDLSRKAIALQKPFGQLEGEIKDISLLADGSLLVALPEISAVQHYQIPASESAKWAMQEFKFADGIANESVSAKVLSQNKVLLALYDDESMSYQTTAVPLKLKARELTKNAITEITADAQTQPVARFGDAADDPEIWVNPNNPEASLILGTDKRYGLYVYDLQGNTQTSIDSGRVNNVDISYGATFKGEQFDIAAASNRSFNTISLYKISQNGQVSALADLPTSLPDVYGLCTYKSPETHNHYVFINDESGVFHQYLVDFSGEKITGKLVREFKVNSQPEGCVADADTQTLYLGEEGYGLWKISAEENGGIQPTLVYKNDQKVIFDDLEGMSIYHGKNEKYLVVSSQGNDSYVVFSLKTEKPLVQFSVGADPANGIDGASETDGLAVTSAYLGPQYPNGLLVVQDGRNVMPAQPQNFKLVNWDKIEALINAK